MFRHYFVLIWRDVLSHQKHSSIYRTLRTRSNSTDSRIWKTRLQGTTYIPTRFSNHIITNNTITPESAPSCPSKTSIFLPHLWSRSNSPRSRIYVSLLRGPWQQKSTISRKITLFNIHFERLLMVLQAFPPGYGYISLRLLLGYTSVSYTIPIQHLHTEST